jgi:hypothetical protein
MSGDWKLVSVDTILDSQYSRENPIGFQHERILQHRATEQLAGLAQQIHRTSELFADKADALGRQFDQILSRYDAATRAATRQQNVVIALTAVIALATAAYAWVNWESVVAMRQSNQTQEVLVELQRAQARGALPLEQQRK